MIYFPVLNRNSYKLEIEISKWVTIPRVIFRPKTSLYVCTYFDIWFHEFVLHFFSNNIADKFLFTVVQQKHEIQTSLGIIRLVTLIFVSVWGKYLCLSIIHTALWSYDGNETRFSRLFCFAIDLIDKEIHMYISKNWFSNNSGLICDLRYIFSRRLKFDYK